MERSLTITRIHNILYVHTASFTCTITCTCNHSINVLSHVHVHVKYYLLFC